MKTRRWVLGAAAVLAAAGGLAVATPGAVLAGKPGGGGGGLDSGSVSFTHQGLVWAMNADGSAKTALPGGVTSSANGAPSHGLHGGRRWFLSERQFPGETYPGSTIQRREYFAVREDGAVVTQLTTQTDLMPSQGGRWSPDDAVVSWPAQRWVGGVAGTSQIFTAALVFDADGNVTGLSSQPPSPAATVPEANWHDWSPDGSRLVVTSGYAPGALWIVTLASSAQTPLATSTAATMPVWSPDGSRIAFAGNDGTIRTIAPDGSGERVLVSRPKIKGATDLDVSFQFPEWSPRGTHLVYKRRDISFGTGRNDVWRVAADGSGATNLTPELNTVFGAGGSAASPLGWR